MEKVLFDAVLTVAEAQITAGPAANKRWTVSAMYCANTGATDTTLTIKHRLDATPKDRTIVPGSKVKGNQALVFGPMVVENGHSIRGSAGADNVVHVTAYGLEEDV